MAEKVKKETGLSTKVDADILAELKASYPTEPTFNRTLLPRLGFYSQDQEEGKGKAKKVVTEAGTFFIEKLDSEAEEVVGKNGKKYKPWVKTEIGTEIEAIILFERRQLKFYDGEKYTSSPVYDSNEQVIPLFLDGKEVDRGTPQELKSREDYQGKSAKGKDISKLEDNKILYVLYEDEIYQLTLRGTSMYEFMTYKKTNSPNTVVTRMCSEAKENGAIEWNQMTFEAVREINAKEAEVVVKHLRDIKEGIEQEKAFFASKTPAKVSSNKALKSGDESEDEDEEEKW